MYVDDDIFGGGNAFDVIIRWHDTIIRNFDKENSKTFEQINSLLAGIERDCYFLKVSDTQQKIIVPFEDQKIQLELYVDWHEKTFSYQAKVNRRKKSRSEDEISIPSEKEFFIKEKCCLVFIDLNESKFPVKEQSELFDRVSKLEILPKTKIENDLEIWGKWIEANDLLLKRKAEPFNIRKYYPILEQTNEHGKATRYKFKVDLKVTDNPEYRRIEEELLSEFHINETFDEEGNVFLKFDDIFRGLDAVIHKKFQDTLEREKSIAAILKLKPLGICERIDRFYKSAGKQVLSFDYNRAFSRKTSKAINISQEQTKSGYWKNLIEFQNGDFGAYYARYENQNLFEVGRSITYLNDEKSSRIYADNGRHITITSKGVSTNSVIEFMRDRNFKLHSIIGEFKVINNGTDITKNAAINKRHKIVFEEKKPGSFFPKPENNVFKLVHENELDLERFIRTLNRIYGQGNVLLRKSLVFQRSGNHRDESMITSRFSEEFWADIKRDLYLLDFDTLANETSGTISYEFETKAECIERLNKLEAINKFEFLMSPTNAEFKFKVKTNLVKNKTEKEILAERIGGLRNAEFQIEIESESKRREFLPIGSLSGNESDTSSLVFTLPIRFKQDQKKAADLLQYIEDNEPKIRKVEPNLRGDQAKISWLLGAMNKISNPTNRPNGKAVNEKLGQFIFDSSKAEQVFKDISQDSEEWNRVKKNELLKLNDSQRKAILSALHARDLCLLQGPPGTGKTTVIAELIWQFICQDQTQKVLLTSETNLAVDNAIEKLLNQEHTLVKPLRFGKDTKLEEEGKKYSFNRILKWIDESFDYDDFEEGSIEDSDETDESIESPDNPYNNAVQIWMSRIAENSHQNANPKYQAALKEWAIELTQPTVEVKKYFKDKYFKHVNVVGSTCSSSGSGSFAKSFQAVFNTKPLYIEEPGNKRNWIPVEFDMVIMDEASKATPPEMLLPLCYAKRSVVIGDHKQLPPMLNEKEFREVLKELKNPKADQLAEEIDREFVGTSQFERLIMNPKVHPSIAARLNIQYRMHPKINNVIKQFYTGETDEGLEPAQVLIENADDPQLSNPFSRHHGLLNEGFINPDIHTIWVNVDEPEEQVGTSRVNEKEAEVVKKVLQYLKNSNGFDEYFSFWDNIKDEDKRLQEQEIGIISFYGQQVRKLQDVRRYSENELGLPVRLKTVDKFQGMERNIIVVSTVRSDKLSEAGKIRPNRDIGFAKAPERLNVALSRARRLLIVVGNLRFFESFKDRHGNAIYKNAIDIIRKEGLIVDYKQLTKYQ